MVHPGEISGSGRKPKSIELLARLPSLDSFGCRVFSALDPKTASQKQNGRESLLKDSRPPESKLSDSQA
jgi:hypothetical protein